MVNSTYIMSTLFPIFMFDNNIIIELCLDFFCFIVKFILSLATVM